MTVPQHHTDRNIGNKHFGNDKMTSAKNYVRLLTLLTISWFTTAAYPPSTLAAFNSVLHRYRIPRRSPIPTTAIPTVMKTRNNIEIPTMPTGPVQPTNELRYYYGGKVNNNNQIPNDDPVESTSQPKVNNGLLHHNHHHNHHHHHQSYGHRWINKYPVLSLSNPKKKVINHDRDLNRPYKTKKSSPSLWQPAASVAVNGYHRQQQTEYQQQQPKPGNGGYSYHQIQPATMKTTRPYESPAVYPAETESY